MTAPAPRDDDLYVAFMRADLHGRATGVGYALLSSVPPITSYEDVRGLQRELLAKPETARGAASVTVLGWSRWEQ